MDFRDCTAVVTGAASGIGRALSLRLADEGARLALMDRDVPGVESLREEILRRRGHAERAVVDVRDREAVRAGIAAMAEKLGPADLLFPCAGVCGFEVIDDLNVPQVERIMQVNFLGVVYAIDAVLPGMLERGSGRIVAMASMTAVRGIPFEASYGASKAALVGYLESLRPSLRKRGVFVTLAYPGFVQTPLLEGLMRDGMTRPPGIIDADTTARKILDAARRRHRVVSFPFSLTALVGMGRLLPSFLYDWIMTRMASQVKLPY